MTVVLTSNIGAGVNTFYDKNFLEHNVAKLVLAPLGQKRPIPKGTGKTIDMFRYNPIDLTLANATLTEGANPTETVVTGMKISAVLKEYGGFSKHSSLIMDTHIDRDLAGVTALWGENSAEILDLLAASEIVSNGSYLMRSDLSTVYQYDGTLDSATATGFTCAALAAVTNYGDTNDDLNQSVITITGGTGYGQSRPVTDYATSGGVGVVSPAWDVIPDSTSTFHVASTDTTLTTSNGLLSTDVVLEAVTLLRDAGAPTINGDYVCVTSPRPMKNLMMDQDWQNVMSYSSGPGRDGMFTGEVGRWQNCRFVWTTRPFRFPQYAIGTSGTSYGVGAAGANYSKTGAVYSNLFLGANAFGVTTLAGNGSNLKAGIIIKNPGPGDTSNALNRFSTVGWVIPFVCKGLNANWCINVPTLK